MAPSEKLRIAGIGVGGQGASDLRSVEGESIVALCDVDWRHAAGTFERYPKARRYRDFREMDPVFRALKLGHPKSVEACCTRVNEETYPVASRVTYEFPAREGMVPVEVHWYDGGMKPPRPQELDEGLQWGHRGNPVHW